MCHYCRGAASSNKQFKKENGDACPFNTDVMYFLSSAYADTSARVRRLFLIESSKKLSK
ncbi:MAG: hypothetical protein ACI8VW_004104 [bacterium]|jgi:hypothetical protein